MFRPLVLTCLLAFAYAALHAVPVSGTVTGPDGKPVAEAQVVMMNTMNSEETVLTTDAGGRYAGDMPPYPANPDSLGLLTVFTPGCALYGSTLKPGENPVTLAKAGVITGRVTDTQGKPVAGVSVAPRSLDTASNVIIGSPIFIGKALQASFTVKTDAVYLRGG